MATKAQGKGKAVSLAEQLIAGTNKHLANLTQVTFAPGSFTPAQITARLQALVNLRADVLAAQAQAKAKLAAEKADTPALRTFEGALVAFVKATFGNAPDVLADFGIHPKTRTPLTVEAKAAAAAKRAGTRAARHTTGAKRKKAIKGAVTGIVVTPIIAPQPASATPTGPSSPAPTGTGATAGGAPHAT
jgi:hypothetical protein